MILRVFAGVSREFQLPRWYPDMLTDTARNSAYERAIRRLCKGEDQHSFQPFVDMPRGVSTFL
jgi:hypothetical protein